MPGAIASATTYRPPTFSAEQMRADNPHFYPDPERGVYSRGLSERYILNDLQILRERERILNERTGPREGDFIIRLDGTLERFSYDHGEPWGIQTAKSGSFYLGRGYTSFSGALEPCVPSARIEETGALWPGWVWFFSQDMMGGGRGVYARLAFRVYRELEAIAEEREGAQADVKA